MSDNHPEREPEPPPDLERLRQAFSLPLDEGDTAPAARAETDVDTVWSALDGALDSEATGQLVDRLAADPEARQAWIVAQEMWRAAPASERPSLRSAQTAPPPLHGWRGLAAAAAVLLAISAGVWTLIPSGGGDPGYRNQEGMRIESLIPEARPLPRQSCRLQWTAILDARYHLRVTTVSLETIADVEDLESPEYTIPLSRLRPLAADSLLLWRVEARLPGGEIVSSRTFQTALE